MAGCRSEGAASQFGASSTSDGAAASLSLRVVPDDNGAAGWMVLDAASLSRGTELARADGRCSGAGSADGGKACVGSEVGLELRELLASSGGGSAVPEVCASANNSAGILPRGTPCKVIAILPSSGYLFSMTYFKHDDALWTLSEVGASRSTKWRTRSVTRKTIPANSALFTWSIRNNASTKKVDSRVPSGYAVAAEFASSTKAGTRAKK